MPTAPSDHQAHQQDLRQGGRITGAPSTSCPRTSSSSSAQCEGERAETGRLLVAARALGVGRAALEDSLAYAQERETFGKPIWQHHSVGSYLADMATSLTAARQLTLCAAQEADAGRRVDTEAGMAKLFASETAMQIAFDAARIHGGYGYPTEFDVERYFRDAPLMIVGEGTNEIQRNVIASRLGKRGGLDA